MSFRSSDCNSSWRSLCKNSFAGHVIFFLVQPETGRTQQLARTRMWSKWSTNFEWSTPPVTICNVASPSPKLLKRRRMHFFWNTYVFTEHNNCCWFKCLWQPMSLWCPFVFPRSVNLGAETTDKIHKFRLTRNSSYSAQVLIEPIPNLRSSMGTHLWTWLTNTDVSVDCCLHVQNDSTILTVHAGLAYFQQSRRTGNYLAGREGGEKMKFLTGLWRLIAEVESCMLNLAKHHISILTDSRVLRRSATCSNWSTVWERKGPRGKNHLGLSNASNSTHSDETNLTGSNHFLDLTQPP